MNTLICYGTRYGATAGTSEEIANFLREEGFSVRLVDAKDEKVNNISEYEYTRYYYSKFSFFRLAK